MEGKTNDTIGFLGGGGGGGGRWRERWVGGNHMTSRHFDGVTAEDHVESWHWYGGRSLCLTLDNHRFMLPLHSSYSLEHL